MTAPVVTISRRELRAMNSDIELLCCAPYAERRLSRAARWLAGFEARFSRFSPLSELSRLNAATGLFRASPALFGLVALAIELARRSGGVFDPTVLRSLEVLGYDRSFERLASSERSGSLRPSLSDGGWRQVSLDAATRVITLPAGAGIDLGGIGKGYAVDRLAAMLGSPSLVNGGGDVYASGAPPDAPAWLVGVTDPFAPERDLAVLRIHDRGVATSSRLRRVWSHGDRLLHHLIDPSTGLPSRSDAVQVTAVAQSCLLADYHAKVALLLGAAAGLDYLNAEADVEGVIVRADGQVLETQGLAGSQGLFLNEIDHTYWYLSRAAGIVAYLLAFASTALGLALTGDVLERWLRRYRVYDFHRYLALITLGFVLLHVFVVLPDRYIAFTLPELLLPFVSPYRPLYMALGIIAFYLMAVVVGSFYVRRLVPYRAWRLLHYATFAVFVLSLVHGVGAGTDTQADSMRYLYAATGLVVFNLLVYRLLRGSARGIPGEAIAPAPLRET